MKYRAEIDGLRALAVVPVILFHAGFEIFSGGFVGVDIFFVISGYLITSILIEDIENKRFSLVNFYERRARRILPALFFVIIVCIPFAWAWMLPSHIQDFSQSLIAVSLFVSNVLFWLENGYFDTEAEEKPLLHTWSLAVEEQYYILFPLLLILTWRFGKKRVYWIIIALAAISLISSEWGWRNKSIANFYLLPTRAWELFAGSIAAFIVQKKGLKNNNMLSLLGLTAIIFSIFVYNETTPFPSLHTLVPVLGVVLLVLYGNKKTLAAKILSTKVFVGIGLISYSAYLWHQPLFAFARISFSAKPSLLLMIGLSCLSLILAIFSWRYIEKPFRQKKLLSRTQFFLTFLISFILIISIGLLGLFAHGNVGRWEQSVESFFTLKSDSSRYVWEEKYKLRNVEFIQGKRKILIVGDSNSGDLINSLKTFDGMDDVSFSSLTIDVGCGPFFIPFEEYSNLIEPDQLTLCKKADYLLSESSINLIEQANVVIFASSWRQWQVDFVDESRFLLVDRFGDKFWWLGNKHLEFPKNNEMIVNGSLVFKEYYPPDMEKQAINQKLKKILGDNFIDPYDFLCSKNNCMAKDSEGRILLYDGFHLTRDGAKYFADMLEMHHPVPVLRWLNRQ